MLEDPASVTGRPSSPPHSWSPVHSHGQDWIRPGTSGQDAVRRDGLWRRTEREKERDGPVDEGTMDVIRIQPSVTLQLERKSHGMQ